MRRRATMVTDAEMRKMRQRCPRKGCEGFVIQCALTRAWWKECTVCDHEWDFCDAGSRPITKEQKDELVRPRTGSQCGGEAEERRAQARRQEQWRQEEDEMTKSKKATKATKDSGKPKTPKTPKPTEGAKEKKTTFASVIKAELEKNPAAKTEDVLAIVNKAFPDAASRGGKRERKASDVAWYRRELKIKDPAAKKPAAKKPTAKRKK